MNLRIGLGTDTHRLVKGRKLMLGGYCVPYHLGSDGHSDADVLIHAICDALLGAAGLSDIGTHFPDTDLQYKDIDSKILLDRTYQLIKKNGWHIVNIDSTIVLQKPKIGEYIPYMKDVLSSVLDIEKEKIAIKAKTSENLGFIGRQEGVSAYAVVLLQQ
ncbi:MAG: 2-C-methyl-D-erythritol 2,4-cyclodiphosphate synthase [Bacteroidetes bacterium ADurb.Bin234]|jgi:2-C-methyl-D-erythritol 2,4-cyclodiphosphate synthase|nr:MAG: 2-C-methyl-D-erythritol 2,4-cyclodiphosphate synthase [Bacteroidetes bacterium ADurb.Bin234]